MKSPARLFLDLGAQHFSCTFSRKWLSSDFHVHFNTAGSHKTRFPFLGNAFFSCQFSHNTRTAIVTCQCAFRLRRLAQNVRRRVLKLLVCGIFVNSCTNGSCGDPGKTLSKRSLHETSRYQPERSSSSSRATMKQWFALHSCATCALFPSDITRSPSPHCLGSLTGVILFRGF